MFLKKMFGLPAAYTVVVFNDKGLLFKQRCFTKREALDVYHRWLLSGYGDVRIKEIREFASPVKRRRK